jgi:MFS family permease
VSLGAAFLAVGMLMLSRLDVHSSYVSLVPGMVVLGIGVGLFYSSVTTSAVTALDPSRSSLAGGIVYMCQIAGGAIGLGLNTAIVVASGSTGSDLADGIANAFMVDAMLGVAGLVIALLFVGGTVTTEDRRRLRWHHRAHA